MPMISTTSHVLWPTGSHWPTIVDSEIAVITAVPANSSGMSAAISAPKAASSRISVIGSEVDSAFLKSWLIYVLATGPVLASPASAISRPGWRAPNGGHGAQRRHHRLVLVPDGDVEGDEHGPAVGRDQRPERNRIKLRVRGSPATASTPRPSTTPARNPHRTGEGRAKSAVRAILRNPRYTGRQVWNKAAQARGPPRRQRRRRRLRPDFYQISAHLSVAVRLRVPRGSLGAGSVARSMARSSSACRR